MQHVQELKILKEIIQGHTLYVIIGDGVKARVYKSLRRNPYVVTIDPIYKISGNQKRTRKIGNVEVKENHQVIGKEALDVAYGTLFHTYAMRSSQDIQNVAFIVIRAHVNAYTLFNKVQRLKNKPNLFFMVRTCCNDGLKKITEKRIVYSNTSDKKDGKRIANMAKKRLADGKSLPHYWITEFYYPKKLSNTDRPLADAMSIIV